MMKFTPKFKLLAFDLQACFRAIHERLIEQTKLSGQIWINATVISVPIPTWSGASRATFQELARELGTTVPIGPIKAKKDRTSLGRSVSSGGFTKDRVTFNYSFFYETDLRYLAYNEFNRAVKGPPPQPFSDKVRFTPYHFQDKGLKAWKEFAKGVRLPNPYNFLTPVNI
jgi:hypothetical protein